MAAVRVWTVFIVFLVNPPRRLFSTSRINQLNLKLKQQLDVAEPSNRKLLIIAGDSHENLHCRQVILSLMQTCRHLLKITHLAVELNQRALPLMQTKGWQNKNFHHYLKSGVRDNWKILPVDKHHDVTQEECSALGMSPMCLRNQGIAEELELQLTDHGLMERLKKLEKTHHVVFINTVSFRGHPYAHAREYSLGAGR